MKISMGRDLTSKVHWFLDNILPPFIRDSKIIMKILAWVIYGKYGKYYVNFKENNHHLTMSKDELKNYYVMVEPIISRPTDINNACIELIEEEVAKQKKNIKILDISCGRGFLSKRLSEMFSDKMITGCDFNIPDYLKQAERDNLKFVEGDIEKLPFQDEEFDMVISTHTLEHVINANAALSELRRVCKKNLIIVVPCQREYKYTMDFHVQFFPYPYSLIQFTGNNNAICRKIGKNKNGGGIYGDLFYMEDAHEFKGRQGIINER